MNGFSFMRRLYLCGLRRAPFNIDWTTRTVYTADEIHHFHVKLETDLCKLACKATKLSDGANCDDIDYLRRAIDTGGYHTGVIAEV